MTVGIVRATLGTVGSSMAELIHLIGYEPRRKALFIKPNVPDSAPPGQGLYTDPAVVDAFLKLFLGRTAVIGEGCIVGRDADIALRENGYEKRMSVECSWTDLQAEAAPALEFLKQAYQTAQTT